MTATVDERAQPAGRGTEAPLTLVEPPPRVLSWFDQLGLWGNLGISLLGPVGAIGVLQPFGFSPLSLFGAALAVVVGTVLGTLLVAAAAVPGVDTGAPSMVLLRGLFGRYGSYLPTLVNIVQLVGWTVFEIVVITQGAQQLVHLHGYRWAFIVVAGVLTTVMAIHPLGAVRVLRRYALVFVTIATAYLFVQLLRHPMPSLTHGSWSGFWPASDVAIAVAVSWAPLASDYSRHARSRRSAFSSVMVGYTVTQVACYVLGLIALATVVRASATDLQHDMFASFLAVPVGWLAFGVLVARELDQSFADSYSTVLSLQNVWPRIDRRLLAVGVGGIATGLALVLDISNYFDFLYLLGSVFVPLTAVLITDYFLSRRRHWDVTEDAPARIAMLLPWALGFAAYQLIYPGGISWWASAWEWVARQLQFTPQTWMSASVTAFLVAAVVTVPVSFLSSKRVRR